MSAEAAALSRSWNVGRYVATLTMPKVDASAKAAKPLHACIEWAPTVPSRLSSTELAQYRRGRDEAIKALAVELGISVAVLDL